MYSKNYALDLLKQLIIWNGGSVFLDVQWKIKNYALDLLKQPIIWNGGSVFLDIQWKIKNYALDLLKQPIIWNVGSVLSDIQWKISHSDATINKSVTIWLTNTPRSRRKNNETNWRCFTFWMLQEYKRDYSWINQLHIFAFIPLMKRSDTSCNVC